MPGAEKNGPKKQESLFSRNESDESRMSATRQQINAWDQTAVKQILDDVVMDTVLKEGYEEDNSISNIKLVVGVIACSFALVSHFYPLPFPQNIFVLEFCCIGGILQYVVQYVEKDYILMTKPKRFKNKHKALLVSTTFPKYDENFTISMALKEAPNHPSQVTKSIANWFDSEGGFVEDVFVKEVQALIASVEKSS